MGRRGVLPLLLPAHPLAATFLSAHQKKAQLSSLRQPRHAADFWQDQGNRPEPAAGVLALRLGVMMYAAAED